MAEEKLKKLVHTCFYGEITLPKVTCWLAAAACLLAGIVYGLRVAPFTHGMTIGSNNGNSGNCNWGKTEGKTDTAQTQEAAIKNEVGKEKVTK